MRRILVIDIGRCSKCMGCSEIAPEIFRYNEATGYFEVVDLQEYPEDIVWEAMKNCPKDCISWEDVC
ncbi:MAG: ferredoxin [Desulfopila sp.]